MAQDVSLPLINRHLLGAIYFHYGVNIYLVGGFNPFEKKSVKLSHPCAPDQTSASLAPSVTRE